MRHTSRLLSLAPDLLSAEGREFYQFSSFLAIKLRLDDFGAFYARIR
jgi:hypothetical protein